MANDLNNNHIITKTPTTSDPVTLVVGSGNISFVKSYYNAEAARSAMAAHTREGKTSVNTQE